MALEVRQRDRDAVCSQTRESLPREVAAALRGTDGVSGSALTVRVNRCGWDGGNKMTRLQLEEEE